ncbi:hypothetical protein Hanom_Chr17g01590291 [Helianthus anomalus]
MDVLDFHHRGFYHDWVDDPCLLIINMSPIFGLSAYGISLEVLLHWRIRSLFDELPDTLFHVMVGQQREINRN